MGIIVRHKRYLPSSEFGKLTLSADRQVTWDGLISLLFQSECAICLEVLGKEQKVLRLNGCGHHFHKHCIERHVQYTMARGAEFAVCPLCRKRIDVAEAIR